MMREPADGSAVDVAAIMQELRDQIAERRRRGLITYEESERLERQRFRSYGERGKIDPELLEALLDPSHDWNIAIDYLVRTRRQPPLGWMILLAKRLVRPFVRLYTDHLLNRQAQINLYVHYFLADTVRDVIRLQIEVAELRDRCERLEAERVRG
jgi:hypothetical protein